MMVSKTQKFKTQKLQEWLLYKIFLQNLSFRLAEAWLFILYGFIAYSHNLAYILRTVALESPKLPNSNYIKLTINNALE